MIHPPPPWLRYAVHYYTAYTAAAIYLVTSRCCALRVSGGGHVMIHPPFLGACSSGSRRQRPFQHQRWRVEFFGGTPTWSFGKPSLTIPIAPLSPSLPRPRRAAAPNDQASTSTN
jgi:hypothetical protein